ncbi:MAG: Organic hydroperoxide resistance protein ohrA [Actinomycetia bacterium]|jgi:Ohr subfamily peroxiredoxin|nr:Organic hydroperoxide resistance protein ohrA [Actinomycetes bacterium]MDQ1458907.1 lipoyl-dependent peroxiredoxin [Actinomycetota bacterium]
MSRLRSVLYTAEAIVEGGRSGHGRTNDRRVDVDLDVPTEMVGAGGLGTNPEQLFAVGYAACFQSTLIGIAAARKLDLTRTRITSRVCIGPVVGDGFGLAVSLDLEPMQLGFSEAATLMEQAHQACPYSRATRDNIEVTLAVGGVTIVPRDATTSAAKRTP